MRRRGRSEWRLGVVQAESSRRQAQTSSKRKARTTEGNCSSDTNRKKRQQWLRPSPRPPPRHFHRLLDSKGTASDASTPWLLTRRFGLALSRPVELGPTDDAAFARPFLAVGWVDCSSIYMMRLCTTCPPSCRSVMFQVKDLKALLGAEKSATVGTYETERCEEFAKHSFAVG